MSGDSVEYLSGMRASEIYPPELRPTAIAVDRVVDQLLRSNAGSLFTPELPIWAPETLTEVKQRFVDQPDLSSDSFDTKLNKQLAGASDRALQLLAEAIYVYYLVAAQITRETKIERIQGVLARMRQPVAIPGDLEEALGLGLAKTGIFYLTNKPFQLFYIVRFGIAWRELPPAERAALLTDCWAFKSFSEKVREDRAVPIKMAIRHFAFPETFEIVISKDQRRKICAAFPEVAPDEKDEDRRLLAIKRSLPNQAQSIRAFYAPEIERLWNPRTKQSDSTAEGSEPRKQPSSKSAREAQSNETARREPVCIDETWLAEVTATLLDNRPIILHGPPGTGKTLVAMHLARTIAHPDRIKQVQFHSSYSYEDFVEGLRPVVGGGMGAFEIRHGPLRRVAADAAEAPNERHVLIIDEINRANLARVIGELVFTLEYRDCAVTLPYSGDRFSLPKNLFIIGTMNTADRSIAIVDSAIRRRFAFYRLAPDCPPIDSVLADWLDDNAPEMGWLDEVVSEANKIIQDPDHAIGPAFFMRSGLDEREVERVWRLKVLPYLDEFLHDSPEIRRRLELVQLRALVASDAGRVS
jgi:5-methylcytosine-specific restriction protein B